VCNRKPPNRHRLASANKSVISESGDDRVYALAEDAIEEEEISVRSDAEVDGTDELT